jgi:phenylpropionate dioxygenase-like ring-hydroxylating dioxygenase large terminal subunit
MLSKEDNELITNTNANTPMGELFRRFWLPVALASELPGPDCTPVRVRVLGEDLIAFRDTQGEIGLVDAYCPHRGAPLFFGRNEEGGLRCVYHGIKFDVSGDCLDIPIAPEGSAFRSKLKIKHYPCAEAGDIIWAYMGPPDKRPPFPVFEWAQLPKSHRYVSKFRLECNYLQAMEGDSDFGHAGFLHSSLVDSEDNPASWAARNVQRYMFQSKENRVTDPGDSMAARRVLEPQYSRLEVNDSGVWKVSVQHRADGQKNVNLGWWKMPIFTSQHNMRMPIDNGSLLFYRLRWSYEPLSESVIREYQSGGYLYPELIPGTWQTQANVHNDYLIDRVAQRHYSFTGIKSFPLQDIAMMENQWGPIADRSQEHLMSSDQAIIFIRRRLLKVAKDLEVGIEPTEPWHPEAYAYHSETHRVDGDTLTETELDRIVEELKEKATKPKVAITLTPRISG